MTRAAPPKPARHDGDSLDAAFHSCRRVTRDCARNFYYGLRLTPEPKHSALCAVYAWMRRADDLADEPGPVQARRDALDEFGRRTRLLWLRGPHSRPADDDPLWPALGHTVHAYGLPQSHFDQLLNAQIDDLSVRRYETFDELYEYCYRVASTVGLICVHVWGHDGSSDAGQLAEWRGVAFQLTNILRDVAVDAKIGRVYLPREDLRRHELTPEQLLDWKRPEACEAIIREQVARAKAFYEKSAPLDGMVHPDGRATLRAMTDIYFGILRRIEKEPRLAVSPTPARLSAASKTRVALAAWVRAKLHRPRSVGA